MKIFVAQIKSLAGDILGNSARIRQAYNQAIEKECDICLLPELVTSGYLAEDLFFDPDFLSSINRLNDDLVKSTKNCALVLPTALCKPELYNGVIVAQNGKIIGQTQKVILPNYGVFDEKRYFTPGIPQIITINGIKVGIPICEDIWHFNVCNELKPGGAEIFLVPNASPFELGKFCLRKQQVISRYNEHKIPIVFCNQATSQDGIIFDGNSFCYDGDLKIVCDGFCEDSGIVEFKKGRLDVIIPSSEIKRSEETTPGFVSSPIENRLRALTNQVSPDHFNLGNGITRITKHYIAISGSLGSACQVSDLPEDDNSSIYQALNFGLKSYVHDNGFKKTILGLSGGIDSALVACICADSLGPENVTAYMLPSKLTSKSSKNDALALAKSLGIKIEEISITGILETNIKELGLEKNAEKEDLTYQNLQARIRGTILMAQANKDNALLITTGNKSEYATGYATIYGDMNGAFNPIKDLYKTQIYAQARWRNSISQVIPKNIITKAPTAELSTNQKDSDSLPEYETLDKILYSYIELKTPKEELYRTYDSNIVNKIIALVRKSEFKRKQSAPGIKISIRNFEKDRRFPLTNLFY